MMRHEPDKDCHSAKPVCGGQIREREAADALLRDREIHFDEFS